MALFAVRGTSFWQYLKDGYNVVRRFQTGIEPDDKSDSFMWLCSAKTLKEAKVKSRKYVFPTEIMKSGKHKPETDK